MRVAGLQSCVVRGRVIAGVSCPYCGRVGQTALGVLSYAHVFGIPLMPVAKQALTECPFCQRTLNAAGHSHEVDREVRGNVFRVRRMLPRFAGAVLLVAAAFGLVGHFLVRHRRQPAGSAELTPVPALDTDALRYATVEAARPGAATR